MLQQTRSAALSRHSAGRTADIQIDFPIASLFKHTGQIQKHIRPVGQHLRNHIHTGIVLRQDLHLLLAAET